jgi:hypothetical protein
MENVVSRSVPGVHLGMSSTIQARARPDGREAIAAKPRVLWAIGVTPLPAGVLTGPQLLNVTGRRQGRRDGVSCVGNGHGGRWARVRGPWIARLKYTDARG